MLCSFARFIISFAFLFVRRFFFSPSARRDFNNNNEKAQSYLYCVYMEDCMEAKHF
jgi:hypothetical protein